MLRPSEPVYVRVWDSGGRLITETSDRVDFPQSFLERSTTKHDSVLIANLPSNAVSVSVAFGSSGLESATVLP
jgi:hypothetical protein